ncbi:aspartate-semialdehyde dehydrogenase [Helicobacter equorum]|uniref:aspartate-semialdehyde dehydrogenase n=1 Tax=Helicobacter equorum TaxID=361872 RepID=UPI000CF044FB|nr:aspartate-semialdehyde dehydrogenase [Helicobacter equorum]
MKQYNIGIVGASGAVGEELALVLEEQNFPVGKFVPLASARSAGESVSFRDKEYEILETTDEVFAKEEIEIVFFSAGGSVSARYAPSAVKAGALVIDNTSHFRMDTDVPLVVPEVNPEDIALYKKRGIIANPNCSTIQMVHILAPLHRAFGIDRVDVSTYQAVSGAGKRGIEELFTQMRQILNFDIQSCEAEVFAHRIALNAIPHIDVFLDNDYTKEEMKMINETNKILHTTLPISATCVRVPVLRSHSESITIRFENAIDSIKAREVLKNAPNVVLIDDVKNNQYPMPLTATETDQTYVGRIRIDNFDPKILHLWCVADQLRVGAATNAVRIAQKWIEL